MDLLLHRYSDMSFIMNLEIDDFLGLVETAIENKRDEEFFAVWKGLVPLMNQDTFISFEDYKSQLLKGKSTSQVVKGIPKTDEEVIADAESVLEMLKV